jgi:serine protease AprX
MSRRTRLAAVLAAALSFLAPPALAGSVGDGGDHTARLSPGIAKALDTNAPDTKLAAFVSVTEGLDAVDVIAAPGLDGVTVVRNYPLVSAAFVVATSDALAAVARLRDVEYVQENGTYELADETASWVTRVRAAQESVPGGRYTDGSGNVLDGSGVGVAVVDGGVNALHPDLRSSVARQFLHVCTSADQVDPVTGTCLGNKTLDDSAIGDGTPRYGWIELPLGEGASDAFGHATSVAGVIAGDGTMSTGHYGPGSGPHFKGTFTGVAPGSTLYSFNGVALAGVMYDLNINDAYYYILAHPTEFDPAIRIVNNSFSDAGASIPFDPASVRTRLTDALVDAGVVMVFAAGNNGGTGTLDQTSSMCDNPKPGVVCVANFDDSATLGNRDGSIYATSSRGLSTNSDTWPDISAPGTFIMAPCIRAIQASCQVNGSVNEARWDGWYHEIILGTGQSAGTSMSAAHVSGAIAMLLQASPSLTPAQVEDTLQDNAYKFVSGPAYVSDPQNSGGTTSYDKGAGLLDVKAALDSLNVSHLPVTAVSGYELIAGDGGDFSRSGGDIVSLKVTQASGSSGATGFRYDLETAGLDFTAPLPGGATYRLWQTIDGVEYMTSIDASTFTVSAGIGTFPAVTAPAEDVTRSGNVVSFFVPFSKLGNVPAGEPIFRVHVNTGISNQQVCVAFGGVSSSCPTTFDTAPGKETGISTAAALHPQYGRPYARV